MMKYPLAIERFQKEPKYEQMADTVSPIIRNLKAVADVLSVTLDELVM